MPTLRVSPDAPDPAPIERAAELLRAGRLVAIPTETVYGLGANALDAGAVARIYEAKGRPARNPLIVHVATAEMARQLAGDWTELAERLASRFWPGPLTLVVRKTDRIPGIVTADGDTVGLRMPSHPVALAVIARAGIPVAAPSANRSNQISPTTAEHVELGLGARVDLILDGGPTTVGIESTVVDVTGTTPRILRPGTITADDISAALAGAKPEVAGEPASAEAPRSPGMLGKHYAPRGRVVLFADGGRADAVRMAREPAHGTRRVGAMVFTSLRVPGVMEQPMPADPAEYARRVYATLHALDVAGCDLILVEEPPATEAWRGVRDRLRRAAL